MAKSRCPFCSAEIEGKVVNCIEHKNCNGTSFSFNPAGHCCLGVKGVLINDGVYDKHLELKSKEK